MIPIESFSYPIFDLSFSDVDAVNLVTPFLDVIDCPALEGRKGLYVHVPFCDTICTFCPFVKSGYTADRVESYVSALLREVELAGVKPRFRNWTVNAIYIGGGTPSVLPTPLVRELFAGIRRSFSLANDVEITFEVEPKSATPELFDTLLDVGVTRVSFGAQTFDPGLRADVNLTASLDQIGAVVERSAAAFTNTNMDMMVGFPGQSLDQALQDMEVAATIGVGSVSVYPVDYCMVQPTWLDRVRNGQLPPPARAAARWEMFHQARRVLGARLTEQNIYCFGTPSSPPCRYMFDILYGGYFDECLGLGCGAYSFLRGVAYHNTASERHYVAELQASRMPVAIASPGHHYEKGLVFFPKRLAIRKAELDALELGDQFRDKAERLTAQGLVVDSGDRLELTEQGKREYDEVMLAFFSDAQRRLYERLCRRLMASVGDFIAFEQGGNRRGRASLGTVNAMTAAAVTRRATGTEQRT